MVEGGAGGEELVNCLWRKLLAFYELLHSLKMRSSALTERVMQISTLTYIYI